MNTRSAAGSGQRAGRIERVSTGLAAGVCVLAAAGGFAVAGEYAGVTVEVDGWTIIPVHDTVATTHLIALRDDDALRATDIDAVLYTRTASGWDAKAYAPGVSKADALVDLAADLGLGDPMALDWELGVDPSGLTGGDFTRAPFGKGFFLSDPLYPAAAAMADPEPLAEFVEALGGASASSAVHTGSVTPIDEPDIGGTGEGGCVTALQDALAFGLDAMIADPTVDLVEVDNLTQWYSQSNFACCWPRTWTNWQGPWSAWDCVGGTGWAFTGRTLLPGGQDNCNFKRQVQRSRMRTRVRRCFNCSQTAVHQTQTQTGWQVGVGGPVLRGAPCPAGPNAPWPNCNAGPNAVNPALRTQTSGWSPALPPC